MQRQKHKMRRTRGFTENKAAPIDVKVAQKLVGIQFGCGRSETRRLHRPKEYKNLNKVLFFNSYQELNYEHFTFGH